ncbi:uncharacterized protein LOC133422318 [Cololabis saira]|uniref:uncharacterized protein LOC133422318 n=1 Tax=Cololabis saira TaxID=129043 RepID=UPI002AD3D4B7|nr:uncharacterized protein LOC133422318 [Cololabis saira]
MTTETANQEVKKEVYICLQKKHSAILSQQYELVHGLFISELNPCLNEGYLQAYFRDYGTVTSCKVKKISNSEKAIAFVKFSTEDEADSADWDGPHYFGGTEVKVKRFVSPKNEDDSEDEADSASAKPPPRRSLGLGYILEDVQWLEDE